MSNSDVPIAHSRELIRRPHAVNQAARECSHACLPCLKTWNYKPQDAPFTTWGSHGPMPQHFFAAVAITRGRWRPRPLLPPREKEPK
jgi:hypothetical protein